MKFILVTKTARSKLDNYTYYPNELRLAQSSVSKKEWFNIIESKDLLRYYDDRTDKCNNVLLICGGGIGDIIAYSALCKYLYEKGINVHYATQRKYFDVLKWFKTPVRILDVNGVLFDDFSIQNRISKYKNWRRIKTEMIIPKNNHMDWFEVIFAYSCVDEIDVKYLRPQLISKRLTKTKSNIDKGIKSLIICNQSSCMMRNIEFNELYEAIPENVKKEYEIYAYINNLSDADKIKQFKGDYDSVRFINAPTLSDFLNDLYDATDVITVDSAAVHFREGINKRCLALFNSFDKKIRTEHYKYIIAANVKSECEKQPCFKHELQKGDLCEKVKEWQYSAPCFRSETNKFLQPELKRIFNEYFK
jgi:hypothetical protein